MSTTQEYDFVSAVFQRLVQPIADLCDQMLRLRSEEPNEVQTSFRENGYAISIIALTAFLLEGACGRVRYVSRDKPRSAPATFRHLGAIVVIKEAAQALNFLELKDRNFVHLTPQHVQVEGKLIPFYKWVRELPI